MAHQIEPTRGGKPSLAKRGVAAAVLVVIGVLVVKFVIAAVSAIFGILVIVAVIVAALWAAKTLL